MAISPASFQAHRSARGGARIDLTRLTMCRSTVVNELGAEEVKKLTPDFGPHPEITAVRGRLSGLPTLVTRDVASRCSDLGRRGADREPNVVSATLPPPDGPETAPVEAWRGDFRASDLCEPRPIASEGRR